MCCLWMPYNDWAYPWVSISDVKLGETFSVNFPGLFLIWGWNSKELSPGGDTAYERGGDARRLA